VKRRYELFSGLDSTGVEALLVNYAEAGWAVHTIGYTSDLEPLNGGGGFWVLMQSPTE
jgi:hypothetical protein